MAKESYRLGEIIFGLDDAYQLNLQALEKLKDTCIMNSKRATDFRFRIIRTSGNESILMCSYQPKLNPIQQMVADFKEKWGYSSDDNIARVYTANDFVCFSSVGDYPIQVKKDTSALRSFYNQSNAILESDFSKHMGLQNVQMGNITLDLFMNFIQVNITHSTKQIPAAILQYDPYQSLIQIAPYQKDKMAITPEVVEYIFDFEVPSDQLTSYHMGIIDTSKFTGAPISLEPFDPFYCIQLQCVKKEKQIVLSSVRM